MPGALLDDGYERNAALEWVRAPGARDRKLDPDLLKPKGSLSAEAPRKTRYKGAFRAAWLRAQRLVPWPSLSLLSSAWPSSIPCVVSMLQRALHSHRARRLPQPRAHAGKAPSPSLIDLMGYNWVTCPCLNQSWWPGKQDELTVLGLAWWHAPTLSQRGSQLLQKRTWGENKILDGFSE